MWNGISRFKLSALALTLLICCGPWKTALAIEVECIEASKYKYVYRIFGNDPAKFAAYFKLGPSRGKLPDGELCRAALLSGGIGPEPEELDKLLRVIAANRGWLATIYLNSGGGDVWMGYRLAVTVRDFRLKTSVLNRDGAYLPDFALPPLEAPPEAAPKQARTAPCVLKKGVPAAKVSEEVASGIVRVEIVTPVVEENSNRPGHDYRHYPLPEQAAQQCQNQCASEARCKAWTYVSAAKSSTHQPVCWLKDAVPAPQKIDGMMSGVILRPDSFHPTYEENVDRPGQDYRTVNLATADPHLCEQSCRDDPQCRAWAFAKPDFSQDLITGWNQFELRAVPARWCASACTFIHAGGIDRHGTVNVHRAHFGGYPGLSKEGTLLTGTERQMRALYNFMDAGQDVGTLALSTSSHTTSAITGTRLPRYFSDYIVAKCHADPEKLETLEQQLIESAGIDVPAGLDLPFSLSHVHAALKSLHTRRQQTELCVAREFERERLEAFGRLCARGCDLRKLASGIGGEVQKVVNSQ
jgi:hypothetical protein